MSRYIEGKDVAVVGLAEQLRAGVGTKVVIMNCRAADAPQTIFKDALILLGKKTFLSTDLAFKESIWESIQAAVRETAYPENWTIFSGGEKTLVMERIHSRGYDTFGFFMCDTWDASQWRDLHEFLRRCSRKQTPLVVVLATEKRAHEISGKLSGLRIAVNSINVPFLDAKDAQKLFKEYAPHLGPEQLNVDILGLALEVSNKSLQGMIHLASSLEAQTQVSQPPLSAKDLIDKLTLLLPDPVIIDSRRRHDD